MRKSSKKWLFLAALSATVAAVATVAILGSGGSSAGNGWPPAAIEGLTHLSRLPAKAAPGFALTDQRGRRVSLRSLRGKVVVMQPMDPECVDICPVVAQEFIDADRALGRRASRAVFLGLNVNQDHEGVADVNAFSAHHGLNRLPNWHFLTGPTAALKRIWRSYLIDVEISKSGEVTHSSAMYFIDPAGRWRWVAVPQVEESAISRWGKAIAATVEHLTGPA